MGVGNQSELGITRRDSGVNMYKEHALSGKSWK